MRELGYEIETAKDYLFEIKGVSSEVMAAFSTRSAEIEASLADRGKSRETAGAAEKQIATLDTREAKAAADHAALVRDWRDTASGAGFGVATRLAMVEQAESRAADLFHRADMARQGTMAGRLVAYAADKLSERQSVFSAALQEEAGPCLRRGP